GSDGRTHLVYELEATNFTSGKTAIKRLVVLDADTGDAVAPSTPERWQAVSSPLAFGRPSTPSPRQ
ncbi:MAG: hypothetical protein WKF53_06640, partial [Rubrobacter sp.]